MYAVYRSGIGMLSCMTSHFLIDLKMFQVHVYLKLFSDFGFGWGGIPDGAVAAAPRPGGAARGQPGMAGERGPAGPGGPVAESGLAPGGTGGGLQTVDRVRTIFPETWLWSDSNAGYLATVWLL